MTTKALRRHMRGPMISHLIEFDIDPEVEKAR